MQALYLKIIMALFEIKLQMQQHYTKSYIQNKNQTLNIKVIMALYKLNFKGKNNFMLMHTYIYIYINIFSFAYEIKISPSLRAVVFI